MEYDLTIPSQQDLESLKERILSKVRDAQHKAREALDIPRKKRTMQQVMDERLVGD